MSTPSADGPHAPSLRSVCVFCGSSNAAPPAFMLAAAEFGRRLAAADVRLVYGGGGVGLMGAVAQSCHSAGGRVLGVMPAFLRRREAIYDAVETIGVVDTMHERKRIMFEQSDAFAVLPGGVGTLEEVIELMSWRRLDLHRKPIVFLNQDDFWRPLFELLKHTVEARLSPAWISDTWAAVSSPSDILPMISRLQTTADTGPGFHGYPDAPQAPGSPI